MDYLYTFPSSNDGLSSLPNLIDMRTKYYTQWWLQGVHEKKVRIYTVIWNILVLGMFLVVTFFVLYSRYKRKPTEEEIEFQRRRDQDIVISKIRNFQLLKKEQQRLYEKISNLPDA